MDPATPKKRGIAGGIGAFMFQVDPAHHQHLLLGLGAVIALPREEEPQIIVPMIDIRADAGASAKEVGASPS